MDRLHASVCAHACACAHGTRRPRRSHLRCPQQDVVPANACMTQAPRSQAESPRSVTQVLVLPWSAVTEPRELRHVSRVGWELPREVGGASGSPSRPSFPRLLRFRACLPQGRPRPSAACEMLAQLCSSSALVSPSLWPASPDQWSGAGAAGSCPQSCGFLA